MKTTTKYYIILSIVISFTGFFCFLIGNQIGRSQGRVLKEFEQTLVPYEELIEQVREREAIIVESLVSAKCDYEKVDEGGLFTIKYKYYLRGAIYNQSMALGVKDVKIRVDYISQTNSIISSEDITIYENIAPKQVINFKENISPPAKTENVKYSIVNIGM